MRKTLCFILCFSLILSGCESTTGLSGNNLQQAQQDNQEVTDIVVGTLAITAVTVGLVAIAVHNTVKTQMAIQAAAEAQFQACVGKTKKEIYAIYGPPNSIVDDAQDQGGTILEYLSISSYGGDQNTSAYTITYRKLFYLNKDNIVTSVKEDTQ
jgi:hypothetical protein